MKATMLLETQHKQVASLIEELEKPGADRQGLIEQLATAIAAHMLIEEELFYPAVLQVQPEIVRQNVEDHESEIPVLLRLIDAGEEREAFTARLQVLKSLLQTHVNKEEGILFPTVSRQLGAENQTLGRQMKQRFDDIVKAGASKAIKLRLTRSAIGREAARAAREQLCAGVQPGTESQKGPKSQKGAEQHKGSKSHKASEQHKGAEQTLQGAEQGQGKTGAQS